MKITYYGHAAVKIENEQYSVLVDPFFRGRGDEEGLKSLGKVDFILVTHGHYDHLGDAIEIAKEKNAVVVSNPEIAGYVGSFGIECIGFQPTGWIKMPFGRLKATNALHTSGINTDHGTLYGGLAFGYVIEMDGKKVYHAGDTGLMADMQLLKREQVDLAILPIGGFYTMDIEEALRAIDFIEPAGVLPIHYNTFGAIEQDPCRLKEKSPVPVTILGNGESMEL